MKLTSNRPGQRGALGTLMLLAAALSPGLSRADTTDCTTIGSLPRVITSPGAYCLAAPIATASTASVKIDIKSDNVVLDCNDNEIAYTGAAGSNGTGVRASGRTDVVIRNCRLVNFSTAISATGGRRVRLQRNHADGSLATGIRLNVAQGEALDNAVSNTLGPNAMLVDPPADSSALVRGNTVSIVAPTASSSATGIRIAGAGRVLMRDNVVRGVGVPATTNSYGIFVASSSALQPSPAVLLNGGMFKGQGTNNYAVKSAALSSDIVCEGTSYFFYTPPYIPGCL